MVSLTSAAVVVMLIQFGRWRGTADQGGAVEKVGWVQGVVVGESRGFKARRRLTLTTSMSMTRTSVMLRCWSNFDRSCMKRGKQGGERGGGGELVGERMKEERLKTHAVPDVGCTHQAAAGADALIKVESLADVRDLQRGRRRMHMSAGPNAPG